MARSCPAGKKRVTIKGKASFCASTRKKRKGARKGRKGNIAALKKGCRTMKAKGFTGKRKSLKAACAALGVH